jgi:hypothetical protein
MSTLHKTFPLYLLLFFMLPLAGVAQTKVTFNVNLTQMMEDSTYVPGRDIVRVSGNLYPLGTGRFAEMKATSENDSVFTTKVNFSRRYNNQQLHYNFEIVTPKQVYKERAPRSITLTGKEAELPAIYFNAYAW